MVAVHKLYWKKKSNKHRNESFKEIIDEKRPNFIKGTKYFSRKLKIISSQLLWHMHNKTIIIIKTREPELKSDNSEAYYNDLFYESAIL